MPYIKSVCRAGRTKEIARYYTRRYHPKDGRRFPKKKETTEQQRKINNKQLEMKLTRIMNANFDDTSWYITFSYIKENRPDIDRLKSHRRELLKKIRTLYKREGKELKYVETAEVGERGAVHIHMVINDIDIRKVKELWKYGFVYAVPLDSTGQYRKLAAYFIKYAQKTRRTTAQIQKKAYSCSRNLERPLPERKVMRGESFRKEIKVPEGWYLDKGSERRGVTEEGYEFWYYTLIEERRSHRRGETGVG